MEPAPLRSATLLSYVPLTGSEPDAKVETLSMGRTLHVCLEADQGRIHTDRCRRIELRFSGHSASLEV
jgi:hypothetical protein